MFVHLSYSVHTMIPETCDAPKEVLLKPDKNLCSSSKKGNITFPQTFWNGLNKDEYFNNIKQKHSCHNRSYQEAAALLFVQWHASQLHGLHKKWNKINKQKKDGFLSDSIDYATGWNSCKIDVLLINVRWSSFYWK